MKRIDADGNIGNQFTDGNSSTGVPATVVDAEWLNDVQEEICYVVEQAGLTLAPVTRTQLLAAIKKFVQDGALWSNIAIANNQVAAANLAGLLFDKTTEYGARIFFHLHRHTATGGSELVQQGSIDVWYKPIADAWDIGAESLGDDAGVTFSVTSAGQVQYVSTNIAGSSYVGEMRVTDVKKIRKV